jgi:hypothetical protein
VGHSALRLPRFVDGDAMTKKHFAMLAKFAKANLDTAQTVALADWLGMHEKNFWRTEFLREAGLTDQQIVEQLQARLL